MRGRARGRPDCARCSRRQRHSRARWASTASRRPCSPPRRARSGAGRPPSGSPARTGVSPGVAEGEAAGGPCPRRCLGDARPGGARPRSGRTRRGPAARPVHPAGGAVAGAVRRCRGPTRWTWRCSPPSASRPAWPWTGRTCTSRARAWPTSCSARCWPSTRRPTRASPWPRPTGPGVEMLEVGGDWHDVFLVDRRAAGRVRGGRRRSRPRGGERDGPAAQRRARGRRPRGRVRAGCCRGWTASSSRSRRPAWRPSPTPSSTWRRASSATPAPGTRRRCSCPLDGRAAAAWADGPRPGCVLPAAAPRRGPGAATRRATASCSTPTGWSSGATGRWTRASAAARGGGGERRRPLEDTVQADHPDAAAGREHPRRRLRAAAGLERLGVRAARAGADLARCRPPDRARRLALRARGGPRHPDGRRPGGVRGAGERRRARLRGAPDRATCVCARRRPAQPTAATTWW